ncbi:hypothetical protein BGX34_008013, partial [Mortierella sp. NVP85]
ITIVSGDSDFLVHRGTKKIIRPIPKSNGFAVYNKSEVIKTLSLSGEDQLTLLGIVQHNDYNANVPGLAIVKNLEIVQGIPITTLDPMLTNYCRTASARTGENVSAKQFENAKNIFTKHVENMVSAPSMVTNSIFLQRSNRFAQLKRLRHDNAHNADDDEGENTRYIGESMKPNQFKNMFESREVMLRGRTIDLTK